MKNINLWKPSKYVYRRGNLRASRDREEVGVFSRLISDLVAEYYDINLRIHAKGELIDLGCGKVPLYDSFKEYVSNCTCVDWKQVNNENLFVDYELDLNNKLPFKDSSFDTILLSDVLEHIRKPELLWSEMYRILRTNGKLIMNVPFFYGIHDKPHDYFRYTKYALKSMAEDAGFKIILLNHIGGLPEIITDITSKMLSVIPVVGRPISVFVQFIAREFTDTKIGNRISKKTGEYFPLEYGLIAEKK